jgi:hypothetical protein
MFTFTTIADQYHRFNDTLINLIPVESLKKPLSQAENVRYGLTVVLADQLDDAVESFKLRMKG